MAYDQLWRNALNEIELQVSRANFITWFKNTNILSKEKGVVVVTVPNGFTKEWLENKYHKIIFRSLRNIAGDVRHVQYVIGSLTPTRETPPVEPKKKKAQPRTTVVLEDQLEIFEIDKETSLNPKYTFSSFIIGSFNELAHAAALVVTKNPGRTYNPLFIYGGVGLGKTHLIQAIGNEVFGQGLGKVKYVTSEKFTTEIISAITNHSIEKVKEAYRNIDVLIIDDIQFLAGKEKTQEEFFHTFNSLYEQNKQIILSSDRPPKAIPTLEERLRSRFEGGMIADIGYPDFETRVAILKAKVMQHNLTLPDEVLEYIANNIQRNIRELEGALNRIVVHSKLDSSLPSLEQVKKVLNNIINSPKKILSAKQILQVVAGFYDVAERDLINKNRRQEIVKPRQIAMYLLREELKGSYPFIGQKLGGRDHTTAIHACEKINRILKEDELLAEEINAIRQQLYNNL
jgi:chromosomal replication initiator protein